jgi:N-acetylmuramic acid 6-phosphate etherase
LQSYIISPKDVVIGIAASGTTPYVICALDACRQHGIVTGCITCNEGTPMEAASDYPVVVVVGPEFVTGSTRMKSGTAQKLVLNMISTAVMIKIGRVEGNRMVNMQLSNDKLIARGTRMVSEATGLDEEQSKALLLQHGSVKLAVEAVKQ